MKLTDAIKAHPDKWLLLKVTKTNELGKATQGQVLAVCSSAQEVYHKLKNYKSGHYSTYYTGKVPSLLSGSIPLTPKDKD